MFLQRVITAIVLLFVFVGAMWVLPRLYWAAFLAPGLVIASVEWARLAGCERRGRLLFSALTLCSFGVLVYAAGAGWSDGLHVVPAITLAYAVAAIFWLAVVPFWLGAAWSTRHPLILGAAGWLALVPTWLALVALQADQAHFLFVLGIVWVADTAAYLVGRRWGRRRLAPAISPGKTWEGVAGAGIAVGVYYALAHAAGIPQGMAWNGSTGLAGVALVTIMSIEGDLFESWLKRQAGVKDSGTLLPGHGGLLDRIDGLTAGVPVAALLTYALPAAVNG